MVTSKEWQGKWIPHSIVSEDQHKQTQSRPAKKAKVYQYHTAPPTVYWVIFYTHFKHHVFSQASALTKHHMPLFQTAYRQTPCVCSQKKKKILPCVCCNKTSSHKTVSNTHTQTHTHDITESPKNPKISTSILFFFELFRGLTYQ